MKYPMLAIRYTRTNRLGSLLNPFGWIRLLLLIPFIIVVWVLFVLSCLIVLPFAAIGDFFWKRSLRKKVGAFNEAGIHFPNAYHGITIPWSDIREVVHVHGPKAILYSVVCKGAETNPRKYILADTPDNAAFERALQDRNIPFRKEEHWQRRGGAPGLDRPR